mgnify:CR=1 FL=1
MIKELPQWAKVLSVISISLILVDIIIAIVLWTPCFLEGCDGFGQMVITLFLLLPFLGMIIGFWIIGFVLKYFVLRRQTIISNTISGIGFLVSLIATIFYFREVGFFRQPFFSGPNVIGFLIMVVVLYFIVALILINKK